MVRFLKQFRRRHLLFLSSAQQLDNVVVLVVGFFRLAFHQGGAACVGHRLYEGFTLLDPPGLLGLNALQLIGDVLQRETDQASGIPCDNIPWVSVPESGWAGSRAPLDLRLAGACGKAPEMVAGTTDGSHSVLSIPA